MIEISRKNLLIALQLAIECEVEFEKGLKGLQGELECIEFKSRLADIGQVLAETKCDVLIIKEGVNDEVPRLPTSRSAI